MKLESILHQVGLVVVVDVALDIPNDPVLGVDVKLSVCEASGVEKSVLSATIRVLVETLIIICVVNAENLNWSH